MYFVNIKLLKCNNIIQSLRLNITLSSNKEKIRLNLLIYQNQIVKGIRLTLDADSKQENEVRGIILPIIVSNLEL